MGEALGPVANGALNTGANSAAEENMSRVCMGEVEAIFGSDYNPHIRELYKQVGLTAQESDKQIAENTTASPGRFKPLRVDWADAQKKPVDPKTQAKIILDEVRRQKANGFDVVRISYAANEDQAQAIFKYNQNTSDPNFAAMRKTFGDVANQGAVMREALSLIATGGEYEDLQGVFQIQPYATLKYDAVGTPQPVSDDCKNACLKNAKEFVDGSSNTEQDQKRRLLLGWRNQERPDSFAHNLGVAEKFGDDVKKAAEAASDVYLRQLGGFANTHYFLERAAPKKAQAPKDCAQEKEDAFARLPAASQQAAMSDIIQGMANNAYLKTMGTIKIDKPTLADNGIMSMSVSVTGQDGSVKVFKITSTPGKDGSLTRTCDVAPQTDADRKVLYAVWAAQSYQQKVAAAAALDKLHPGQPKHEPDKTITIALIPPGDRAAGEALSKNEKMLVEAYLKAGYKSVICNGKTCGEELLKADDKKAEAGAGAVVAQQDGKRPGWIPPGGSPSSSPSQTNLENDRPSSPSHKC